MRSHLINVITSVVGGVLLLVGLQTMAGLGEYGTGDPGDISWTSRILGLTAAVGGAIIASYSHWKHRVCRPPSDE